MKRMRLRIGEALALRRVDIEIDVSDKVIWVVPRADNENGARQIGRVRGVPLVADKRRAVEDAIHALAREGHPITFRAVARPAAVSRAYLYKNSRSEISPCVARGCDSA